jgi:hypothetical protein
MSHRTVLDHTQTDEARPDENITYTGTWQGLKRLEFDLLSSIAYCKLTHKIYTRSGTLASAKVAISVSVLAAASAPARIARVAWSCVIADSRAMFPALPRTLFEIKLGCSGKLAILNFADVREWQSG